MYPDPFADVMCAVRQLADELASSSGGRHAAIIFDKGGFNPCAKKTRLCGAGSHPSRAGSGHRAGLPFLTGQIPQIGSMLCPMHIPRAAARRLRLRLAVGWLLGSSPPLLRSVLFGMPDISHAVPWRLSWRPTAPLRVCFIGSIMLFLVLSMIAGWRGWRCSTLHPLRPLFWAAVTSGWASLCTSSSSRRSRDGDEAELILNSTEALLMFFYTRYSAFSCFRPIPKPS